MMTPTPTPTTAARFAAELAQLDDDDLPVVAATLVAARRVPYAVATITYDGLGQITIAGRRQVGTSTAVVAITDDAGETQQYLATIGETTMIDTTDTIAAPLELSLIHI